jgi:hypothetical protein
MLLAAGDDDMPDGITVSARLIGSKMYIGLVPL